MRASQSVSHLVIALSLVTAAVSPMHRAIAQNTTPYPTETVKGFTETCATQGTTKGAPAEAMRQICVCTIEAFQKTYTFDQFAKIDSDLGAGKPAPVEMNQIVQDCVKQVASK